MIDIDHYSDPVWEELQLSWDAQQAGYLPDREDRFTVMLDVVEETCGRTPHVLDLAGGTGSISRRLLSRLPDATSVVVDVDPLLLAIAAGSFAGDDRVTVVDADLTDSTWTAVLPDPRRRFDAVLTATALHWLTPDLVARVYADAGGLLRPGGVLANADHLPDADLDGFDDILGAIAERRCGDARQTTGADDWVGWWDRVQQLPQLAGPVAARQARASQAPSDRHDRSQQPSAWHVNALRRAGFAPAGLVWRSLGDAVVVGVRP